MFRANITYSVTLFVAAALASPAFGAQTFPQPAGWPLIRRGQVSAEPIGPGVTYARWQLDTAGGPLTLSITTVDLRDRAVRLEVVAHHDVVVGAGESLSAMADRTGAEAGVNGDYFDINATGSPLNVLVLNRAIEHNPDGKAALAIGEGNRVAMGPLWWSATLTTPAGFALPIAAVNDFAPATSVTLVTPRAGDAVASGLTEVVLDPAGAPTTFRVSRVIADATVLAALDPGQIGVAARGVAATQLASSLAPGSSVEVAQQWQVAGSSGSIAPAAGAAAVVTGIVAALGGGPLLLRNGTAVADPDPPAPSEALERYPLTGAGISADGNTLTLVTIDGRSPRVSVGITRPMLAELLAALGASDAMAFDTGGSAEMVVRRLGDRRVSVANVPSDGRERPIADGLFVINSSAASRAHELILRPAAPAVLIGGVVPIVASAVDRNLQPADVPSPLEYSVDPADVASIDREGRLRAMRAGTAQVVASAGGVSGAVPVRVVDRVARLTIIAPQRYVPVSGGETLRVSGQAEDGSAVWIDPVAVRWSVLGSGARMKDGRLIAGARPARVKIVASAGGASAGAVLPIGEHGIDVALRPERWRYAALPSSLGGGVSSDDAPDGTHGLHLSYDFSTASGFRAAYARAEVAITGDPLSISLEVFGDGHNEWLRGAYRNADGVVDTVTFARHVDWSGWRKVGVQIPAQARFPIAWLSLYAIEAAAANQERGDLWFRSLRVTYPGP